MSQHKDITIPLWLVFAGIVLPNLLPDWGTLEKILPSGQEHIWTKPAIKASIGAIIVLVPYVIYQRFPVPKHTAEQRTLFEAAISIIKARTRLTIDMLCLFLIAKHPAGTKAFLPIFMRPGCHCSQCLDFLRRPT